MMIETLHYLLIPVLFLTGLAAGTIDAIAGGGGLISLPMLLAVGIPPHIALGTNKLQTSFGTSIATFSYYRKGLFSLKTIYKGLIFGLIGAISGAVLGQVVSSEMLRIIIPFLLMVILIYTLLSPKLGEEDKKSKINEFSFYIIFGFMLGFYDGFFGPGTGSLWVFTLTFFLGYNLTKATAYTKVFNLKSNIIATICFAFGQNIDYRIALYMAAGQMIGGKIGAYLAIRNGPCLIRPIFITVVIATIISLTYRHYSQSKFFLQIIDQLSIIHFISLATILIISLGFLFVYTRKKRDGSKNFS